MKLKKKKMYIALSAIITVFVTVFASANGIFATNKSSSLMLCNASNKNCGVISEYNSSYAHENILYALVNDKIAYCMNYSLSANNGQAMKSSDNSKTSLSSKQREQLLLALHFGYYTSSNSYPQEWQRNQYIATQAMVWNIVKNLFGTNSGDTAAKKICNTAPSPSASYEYYKNIKNRISACLDTKKPSFASDKESSVKTYKLEWSEENKRFETTITDKNSMLSNYKITVPGYTVSKKKNTITISTKKANTKVQVGTVQANEDIVRVGNGAIYWSCSDAGHQEFVSGRPSAQEIKYYFKVQTTSDGHLKLFKTDSEDGTPLKNAEYGVYSDSECKELISTLTTNDRGLAETSALKEGKYYVKELKAPEGYSVNPKIYTSKIEAGKTTTLRVEDDKINIELTSLPVPTGSLVIEKEGEVLTEWEEGKFSYDYAKLSNAVFSVIVAEDIVLEDGTVALSAGDKVGEITTAKNGNGVLNNLPYGTYYIEEISAPEGYILDPEQKKVVIDATTKTVTVKFENKRQKFELSIIKKDAIDKTHIAGAEFDLFADSDILDVAGKVIVPEGTLLESAVSDENGIVSFINDYPMGTYIAKEKKAPSGYLMNKEVVKFDVDYQVSDKEVVEYKKEFLNTPVTVEISKMDITNSVELAGAQLSVIDSQGKVVDSWESKKGESHSITKLAIGETYTLHEEIAPYGFLVAEDIKFTVEDTGKVQKVVMHDMVPTGTIKLTKKGEYLKGVKKDENGQLTFEYSNEILSGVKFDVYAAEDVISLDGQKKVYYKAGELVGSLTTDEKGTATMNTLPLGKYNVVETSTLDDFVLTSEPQLADLSYVDQNTKEVVADMEIINKPQKLEVTICKKDADNGNVVSGAAFGVYAKNDILNYDGEVIVKADTLISITTSDNDGLAVFSELLPLGEYYVKEEKAPEGYVKEDRIISLSATYDKEKGEIQSFKADVENHPTKIDICKTDITGEQEIAGAKLSIIDTKGNVIDTWVSEGKPHRIEKLPVGKYILREELAPYGYVLAEDIEFEVAETEEIQQCIMKDDYTKGKLQIIKTDADNGNVLEGAKFEIRDENDNVVEVIVTNENGVAESQILPIAVYKDGSYLQEIRYKIVEVEAPQGYILDDTVNEMSFTYVDDKTPVIMQSYSVTNKRTEITIDVPNVPNTAIEESVTEDVHFSNKAPQTEIPQTGDRTNVWRYVVMMVVSGVGIFLCIISLFIRKKKLKIAEEKQIFKS